MIENFNGLLFLVLHILVLIMISFYLIRIIFAPSGIAEEFGVDKSGIYFARIMGTFIAPLFMIGTYIIFRDGGPAGCWIWFVTLVITSILQLGYESSFYFKKIDAHVGAKNKLLDVIVSAVFTIISLVLVMGLSDKIYL
jgi:phage shock protein PspC (stress-responsive transcriptional regulator)